MFKRFIFLFFFLVAAFVSKAQNTFAYTDVSLHFRNAVELYEKKNYAAAREEFQVYLDKEALPDNKDQYNRVSAHYYVAVCALLLNYPEAELLADRFVVNYAEYPQAGQLFKQLGLYYFDNEDFNKSATYLEKVGSRHLTEEESLEVRLKLGISYYNLQNYDKALQIFTSIKQYSNNKYGEIASYYSGHLNFRKEN